MLLLPSGNNESKITSLSKLFQNQKTKLLFSVIELVSSFQKAFTIMGQHQMLHENIKKKQIFMTLLMFT